jgi:predicted transcriptional regulator
MIDLPQSSKTILGVLTEPMSIDIICEKTGRSERTVRYGIRVLDDRNMLVKKLNVRDMRKIIYSLKVTP